MAKPRPADRVLCFSRKRIRGGGKVENLLLFFHFPIRLVAGAVEMWESRLPSARFPRGSWKEGEACFWLSTLSTAPAFPYLSLPFGFRCDAASPPHSPAAGLSACWFFLACSTR